MQAVNWYVWSTGRGPPRWGVHAVVVEAGEKYTDLFSDVYLNDYKNGR